jgi:di/tricarboxylate transporter
LTDAGWTFATIAAALVLFAGGWWRYDVVALLALLALTFVGVVPSEQAFSGFGHAAVVTVAAVLVVSRGLQSAGVVDLLGRPLAVAGERSTLQVAALCLIVAVLSAFMNNVGALALLLPAAVRMAEQSGRSPARLLMPLSFASLLGGLCTSIGTPPNLIVAEARADAGAAPFSMFDFTPVGVVVTLAGLAFISLLGWRLVPERRPAGGREGLFSIEEYLTELRVAPESTYVGRSLADIFHASEVEAIVLALLRGERRVAAPAGSHLLRPDDVLLVEVAPDSLQQLCDDTGLLLAGDKDREQALPDTEEVVIVEAVVTPGSLLVGRTIGQVQLRWRFGTNLLGVAREGRRVRHRLRDLPLRAGDVILIQADVATLSETLASLGCLPLAERRLGLGQPRRLALAIGIFVAAVATSTTGLVALPVVFTTAAVAMLMLGVLSLRDAYDAIDWPVIVLLGAMLPVGTAFETSGGAEQVASLLRMASGDMPLSIALAMLMVVTMLLSNVVNNAAAAVIMVPVALQAATHAGLSPDAHLMAVAIGASCAFLTPIGHQNNTLVLGPGGFRFGDYWRLGLPLSLVVVCVAAPLLVLVFGDGAAAR